MAKVLKNKQGSTPSKHPGGRPTTYNPEIAATICERLANAESLLSICSEDDMPGYTTVYQWRDAHPEFANKLARAREDMADYISHQIIAISDEQDEDWVMTKHGPVFNKEAAARSRIRIEARLKMMQMLKPKSYGDKVRAELSGPDGGPIQHELRGMKAIREALYGGKDTAKGE